MNITPSEIQVSRLTPPSVSPTGRAPDWLTRLFPGIGDLSQNPLYIRLANQGYGRRSLGRRLRGPIEFRATSLDWLVLTRVGFWPIFIWLFGSLFWTFGPSFSNWHLTLAMGLSSMLSGPAWSLGVTRILLGRSRHYVIHFFRRASLQGWGEELALTHLSQRDIQVALFATLLPLVLKRILILQVVMASFFLATGALQASIIAQASGSHSPLNEFLMIFVTQISYRIVICALVSGFEVLDLSKEIMKSPLAALEGRRTIRESFPRQFTADSRQLLSLTGVPFGFGILTFLALSEYLQNFWLSVSTTAFLFLIAKTTRDFLQILRRADRQSQSAVFLRTSYFVGALIAGCLGVAFLTNLGRSQAPWTSVRYMYLPPLAVASFWCAWLIRGWINSNLFCGADRVGPSSGGAL